MKHTKEPWILAAENCGQGRNINSGKDYIAHSIGYQRRPGSNQRTLSETEAEANAKRIVECVNALAGYNPAAVRECVEALRKMVSAVDTTGTMTLEQALEIAKDALAALNQTEIQLPHPKG